MPRRYLHRRISAGQCWEAATIAARNQQHCGDAWVGGHDAFTWPSYLSVFVAVRPLQCE
jgi:hypothetical protein